MTPVSVNVTPTPVPEIKSKKVIIPECNYPEMVELEHDIIINNSKTVKEFEMSSPISFSSYENYSNIEGITCFRGNNYRNSASYGYADIDEGKLEKVWSAKVGYIGNWTGVGWTGQPAIVKWNDSVKRMMNISNEKKDKKNLKEVLYAALDGKIYFLDLDDGKPTRSPINSGYPFKGSITVDPRGFPLLYAGQGINYVPGKKDEIGYRVYNLINRKQIYFLNGKDKDRYRQWGAFDSNGLIDAKTDTLIECGENGLMYLVKLNTIFDMENGSISISPDIIKYRYKHKKNKIGIEGSPVCYKNYIYFADNSGILQCLNINTLKPVWAIDVTDDTDSTVVLEEESEGVYLYTACEVDIQGENGYSHIRKINALTGKIIWEKSFKCYYNSINGGVMASPILGKKDIDNLVIFSIARTNGINSGKIVAIDKRTAKTVWTIDHPFYCWSSPVALYTKSGKSYIVFCDSGAYMNLVDGSTGNIIDKISLLGNVEASPAVYNDMIVVGTRGQLIWGIRVK